MPGCSNCQSYPGNDGCGCGSGVGSQCEAVAKLYRFRVGDSSKLSIWICSRNDAISNLAVMLAAAGVFASGSRWPDLLVAVLIAALIFSAALHVARLALSEMRQTVTDCRLDAPLGASSDVS